MYKELVNYFDKGGRIYFREVRLSDINENYYKWMNDTDVIQYLESRFYPNSLELIKKFVENSNNDESTVLFAICSKEENKHIGNIKLGKLNWIHRSGEAAIMIGDKTYWGKGYGSEAIKLLIDYAFSILNLNKINAECYINNKGSLNAFKKAGFKEEGLRKKQYFCNGEYVDAYMLGLVKEYNAE